MVQDKLNAILQLPEEEKIEIYEALQIDLYGEDSSHEELTEEEKKELDRRLKKVADGTAKFYAWEEVERRLSIRK